MYSLGCVSYQRDCFTEGVPLLAIACEELRVWCFNGKKNAISQNSNSGKITTLRNEV